MNRINVLDCTLRDGGYCNEWNFGFGNVKKIVKALDEANIEIIECGFLTNTVIYDADITKFTNFEELARVIPENKNGKMYVAMLNYGEYNIDEIPACDSKSVDGLRVAFHKKDLKESLEICEKLKDKGYKVFVQAMVSLSYSDEEFLSMIKAVNKIQPYAFYIVDSFGMMNRKSLIRLFYMIEHNLSETIWIGFHSHNNMQLAYSNAQSLVDFKTDRRLILDSSIYGMGRGAGNLNTELFVEYLNEYFEGSYNISPLLNVIDEVLDGFYKKNYWGYSLPNYLSAMYNAHPNYATYLDDKGTLTVNDMNEIFKLFDADKCVEYDKRYCEKLYLSYMENDIAPYEDKDEVKRILEGKEVLLIAPGKNAYCEKNKVKRIASESNVIVISINFEYTEVEQDFIFISNLRRLRELDKKHLSKCIATSNLHAKDVCFTTNYTDLLNDVEYVKDNAGLLAIKFLQIIGVEVIYLAGFDGYSHELKENYIDEKMGKVVDDRVIDGQNQGMKKILKKYRQDITLNFVTSSKYQEEL